LWDEPDPLGVAESKDVGAALLRDARRVGLGADQVEQAVEVGDVGGAGRQRG
jgi:hypothetical protein